MQCPVIIQDGTTEQSTWLSFAQPSEIVLAHNLAEVDACWQRVEAGVGKGLYAAGFVSYEAAPAFDSSLLTHPACSLPLLWFGLYPHCQQLDALPAVENVEYTLGDWEHSVSKQGYFTAVAAIKEHIRAGDCYQINYTHRMRAPFSGDPRAFFVDLCQAQHARYAAYLDTGDYQIASVSPELFIHRRNGRLVSRPMKGTVERGYNAAEDAANAQWLKNSAKNRAENLMIVDMLRNDMGRIATTGTVKVSSLFDIESYPTVHQMTSTVESKSSASVSDIFRAMFPCASVTGAPKAKTMQLIRQLESDPRGVYTGSIGFIKPDGEAQFNVAIRTVVIDADRQIAEYGTGGGIVWDSDAASEYAECKAKAAVLSWTGEDFKLLETLLWRPGQGDFLLDEHLQRCRASAEYFAITIDLNYIEEHLLRLADSLQRTSKVRLLVGAHNNVTLQARDIHSLRGTTVVLDSELSDTQTAYCYHKTSRRRVYDDAKRRNSRYGDVILVNRRGFITESTLANVVIQSDGTLYTPERSAGLLAGVFRDHLLSREQLTEAAISTDQLLNAEQVWLINSVRGWMPLRRTGANSWLIEEAGGTALDPAESHDHTSAR